MESELDLKNRVRACALGAAIGDALGMPLEFCQPSDINNLVVDMLPGRLPAGSFTDDTEMALLLAESYLNHNPLNMDDLANRFSLWCQTNPPDIGIQTKMALSKYEDSERLAGSQSLASRNTAKFCRKWFRNALLAGSVG